MIVDDNVVNEVSSCVKEATKRQRMTKTNDIAIIMVGDIICMDVHYYRL
jgi:hypothetical protein